MSKVQGTVKWFSNQKGYGFITPTSEDSPIKEDIFVHQSAVHSDGFRSLSEGWIVEFEVGKDDKDKLKALNVTAPGGGPCTGPRTRRIRNKPPPSSSLTSTEGETKPSKSNGKPRTANKGTKTDTKTDTVVSSEEDKKKNNGKQTRNSAPSNKEQQAPRSKLSPWHSVLTVAVKNSLRQKSIRTKTGTVDISFEEQRIKLGTGGYAAMAHADGMLAEGTFTTTEDGVITFTWNKAMVFEGGDWKPCSTADGLLTTLDLTNDNVKQVGVDETPETLWGVGKTNPEEALKANGFQMRQVVLTRGGKR